MNDTETTDLRPTFERSAGILLHPTSLPGPDGIGALGPAAIRFLDLLAEAGVSIWQMLPLGPTGYGDSPYQCFSAFAGNPLLIHVPGDGTLPAMPADRVDFDAVVRRKKSLLEKAVAMRERGVAYRAFVERNADWLPDYALFMALKEANGGANWTSWEPALVRREPTVLAQWRERLSATIEARQVEQFLFAQQYEALRVAARERGIRLMGDVPIYVAHDSADVWVNRDLFELNEDGSLRVQAGVPPDYFSATGQLWGNPLYRWPLMQSLGYAWWIRRLEIAFDHFDIVRLDHFRGFESYWEVPGGATTAADGRWVVGPGRALFTAVERALGPVPIVAENLGLITPEVEALREACGFPGMCVLQFAFADEDEKSDFLPHRYSRDQVVYTGTHDNDTTVGWWRDNSRGPEAVTKERDFARRYLDTDGREIHWTLIRAALASVAHTALIPLQDVLGLGSDARMNLPGRQVGNWQFRFTWEQLTPDLLLRFRKLAELYERVPRTGNLEVHGADPSAADDGRPSG